LMCCLAFEQEGYSGRKKCPKAVKTDDSNTEMQDEKQTLDLERMDEKDTFNN